MRTVFHDSGERERRLYIPQSVSPVRDHSTVQLVKRENGMLRPPRATMPYYRRLLVGLLVGAGACEGTDCVTPPCALPLAIVATVVSASGARLPGLFIEVATPAIRVPCDSLSGRCAIVGSAGTYVLSIGATGYQTVQRTVTVPVVRNTQSCGCDAVTTQQLQLTLVPL